MFKEELLDIFYPCDIGPCPHDGSGLSCRDACGLGCDDDDDLANYTGDFDW